MTWKLLCRSANAFVESQPGYIRYGEGQLAAVLRLFLFAVCFFIFSQRGWGYVIGMVGMSYAYSGLVLPVTHDASHYSFSRYKKINTLMSWLVSDCMGGQSHEWWHDRHVKIHHVYTNMDATHPSVLSNPGFNKYVYLFFAPYSALFYGIYHSFKFLRGSWKGIASYTAFLVFGLVANVWLFSWVVPVSWAIVCVVIQRSLFAPILFHLALFHHAGLDQFDCRQSWQKHQTKSTRNLKPHWFLRGMCGNGLVHCHLEHHLLPSVSDAMLPRIKQYVLAHLRQQGVRVEHVSYWFMLRFCLQNFDDIFIDVKRVPAGSSKT